VVYLVTYQRFDTQTPRPWQITSGDVANPPPRDELGDIPKGNKKYIPSYSTGAKVDLQDDQKFEFWVEYNIDSFANWRYTLFVRQDIQKEFKFESPSDVTHGRLRFEVKLCDGVFPHGAPGAILAQNSLTFPADSKNITQVGSNIWFVTSGEIELPIYIIPLQDSGCFEIAPNYTDHADNPGLYESSQAKDLMLLLASNITGYYGLSNRLPNNSNKALKYANEANQKLFKAPEIEIDQVITNCEIKLCLLLDNTKVKIVKQGRVTAYQAGSESEYDQTIISKDGKIYTDTSCQAEYIIEEGQQDAMVNSNTIDITALNTVALPVSGAFLQYENPRVEGDTVRLRWRNYFEGGEATIVDGKLTTMTQIFREGVEVGGAARHKNTYHYENDNDMIC
jgi:hypothetical protein